MNKVVAVVGEGVLAELLCRQLSGHCRIVRQSDFTTRVPNGVELVLVVNDDWGHSDYVEAENVLRQANMPWLSGSISFNEGVVGPFVCPSTPGCSQCANSRRLTARHDDKALSELLNALLTPAEAPRNAQTSRSGLWQVAHLLVAETRRVLEGRQAHVKQHLYIINLETLKMSLHFFLPDPLCSLCSKLPDDSAVSALIQLSPRPKLSPEHYRIGSIDDLKDVLGKDYLDPRTGLLNEKAHDYVSPFAAVSVNLPSFMMGDQLTGGRSHSYMRSELTAILEGLERYCGEGPRGKRSVIYDSFNNLVDQALDPVSVGLYSKEQYAQPDFPFEPFDPQHKMDWVWGYSFLRELPIVVPESLAYYSIGYGEAFVQEGSNGCALGKSVEEAILYGILEVVERDAFLMTWYAKLPVPRLDPLSANDKELRLMIERLRAVAGYDVHLFNMTMENGIPSIWALAKSNNQSKMNLISAAASHLDPIVAAKNALHELSGLSVVLQERFRTGREEFVQMLYDPFLVHQMEDHLMLYSLPQAEERLSFLLDCHRPVQTFDEAFKLKLRHTDLTDDLMDVIHVFLRLNLDVIVVDQTSPELLRNALHCVKVLIPGMLPMTFGHHLARLTGLERLFKIPAELGYVKESLTVDQLNPHPHPFS